MKRRTIVGAWAFVIASLFILSSCSQIGGNSVDNEKSSISSEPAPLSAPGDNKINYIPHAPFRINSNAEFAAMAIVEGWPGDGSQGSPFIIDNYEINGNSENYCIYIGNTTCFFIIQNCSLHDASGPYNILYYVSGLILNHVENGYIINNNASSNGVGGIYIYFGNNHIVINNIAFLNNLYGISFFSSDNNTIAHNNASFNEQGILLSSSSYNTLTNNNATSNDVGINLCYSSNYNTIAWNNATSNNNDGILLDDSNNNTITNNTASSAYLGIGLYWSAGPCLNNLIFHNTFIGNPMGVGSDANSNQWNVTYPIGGNYWSNYTGIDVKRGPLQDQPGSDGIGDTKYYLDVNSIDYYPLMKPLINGRAQRPPIRINSNSEFDPAHGVSAGNGTVWSPWIIENYDINGTGYGYCIYVGNTTDYFVVRNCYLHEANGVYNWPYYCASGIILYNVQSGNIANNIAFSNRYMGMYLHSSSNTTIANNSVNGNPTSGIYLNICYSNNLTNNNISNNTYGIYICYSNSNKITKNNASLNSIGIILNGTSSNNNINNNTAFLNDCGIYLSSDSNTITNNTILNNYYGIYLSSSDSNTIAYNTASLNNYTGIQIDYSNNNSIKNNTIKDMKGKNAQDGGSATGIYLISSNSNILKGNNIFNITGGNASSGRTLGPAMGIRLENSSNNEVIDNDISDIITGEFFYNPQIWAYSISFSTYQIERGDLITIYAEIRNVGMGSAAVDVKFYDGNESNENLIGIDNIFLNSLSQEVAQIDWVAAPGGLHLILVTALINVTYANQYGVIDPFLGDNYKQINVLVSPNILLVDDDAQTNDNSSYDTVHFMRASLEAADFDYDFTIVAPGSDGPGYDYGNYSLKNYDIVIWMCGYEYTNTLTKTPLTGDLTNLQKFLKPNNGTGNGGSLWFISQSFWYEASTDSDLQTFALDYLHVPSMPAPLTLYLPTPLWGNSTHPVTNCFAIKPMVTLNRVMGDLQYNWSYYWSGVPVNPGVRGALNSSGTNDFYATSYNSSQDPVGVVDSRIFVQPWEFSRIGNTSTQAQLTYKVLMWLGNITIKFSKDVAISEQTVSPDPVYYQENATIKFVIRNNGFNNYTASDNLFYLLRITDTYGNDLIVPVLEKLNFLDTGNNNSLTITYNWTPQEIGYHKLEIKIDPWDYIDESNELNNEISDFLTTGEIDVQQRKQIMDTDGSAKKGWQPGGQTFYYQKTSIPKNCIEFLGETTLSYNTGNISINSVGIYTNVSYNNTIKNNSVSNTELGICLESSDYNSIYHNNFVGNLIQAYDDKTNFWDNSYPSGGNYWSDYSGVDLMSGYLQDQPGSDGIGDTPFVIDGDSRDNYPLMSPFDYTEYDIPLQQGWNLISLPTRQLNWSIDSVLESIAGKWDCIQTYDPITSTWQTNITYRPDSLNTLYEMNHFRGYWINITEPGVTLTVKGDRFGSTLSIPLKAGWNLVGYPSLAQKSISDSFLGTGYDSVEGFNAGDPYRTSVLPGSYLMTPGEGYWVHVPTDTIWIVDW